MTDPLRDEPPPWEARELPSRFDLATTARRLGAWRWVELQLFEALGEWMADASHPDVTAMLARHAALHAWHAELLGERLPAVPSRPDLDADVLTAPASPAVAAVLAAVRVPELPDQVVEALAGVYRVALPRLVAVATFQRHATNAVTDAPTVRVLDLVRHDLATQWAEGEQLLQALLRSADAVRRAAAHQAAVESLVIAAGGLLGPTTIS